MNPEFLEVLDIIEQIKKMDKSDALFIVSYLIEYYNIKNEICRGSNKSRP